MSTTTEKNVSANDSAKLLEAAKQLDADIRSTAGNANQYLDFLNVQLVQAQTPGPDGIAPWQMFEGGWDNFESYVSDVVQQSLPRMHKLDRAAVILALSDAGLSQRAIADAVKKSPATVNAEIKRANQNVARGLDRIEAESKPASKKGKAEIHAVITGKGAVKSVNRIAENIGELSDPAELADLVKALNAAVKAAKAQRVGVMKNHPSVRSGAEGTTRTGVDRKVA